MFKKIKNGIIHLFDVYCHEFRLVMKDEGIILFFIFLPLAYPVIYSLIYNPELVKDVDMVVVDHDRSAMSRRIVRMIDACDEAHVIGYAADLSEARRAMNEHKAYAILEIPENFGKQIGRGETANAVMYAEMSLLLRYRGFLVATTNVMQQIGSELLTEDISRMAPMAETVMTGDPLPVNDISLGNIRNGFDSFIMPCVLILILQQCLMLAIGMAGGARMENRKIVGYNPINMTRSVLMTMIGQSLCYITIIAVPMIFLIHYVPLIFRFPMAGSLLDEVALLTPMVIATCGMGYVYQAFVKEREEVFVSWVFTSLVFLLLSGLIWPRYAMPEVWRALSAICPATWGVEGFVKINSNGAELWQVRTEFINLWILAGAWWIAGWAVRRWIIRPRLLPSAEK